MKDLLINPLNLAFEKLEKIVPKTKTVTKNFDISDVSPLNISKFITDNNIPTDCYFWIDDDGHYPILCYDYQIELTEMERERLKRIKFESIAFQFVTNELRKNNYVIKQNDISLNSFRNLFELKSVYDSYLDKNFTKLSSYYSLIFKQKII